MQTWLPWLFHSPHLFWSPCWSEGSCRRVSIPGDVWTRRPSEVSVQVSTGGETRTEEEKSTPMEHTAEESESPRLTLGGLQGNSPLHRDLGSSRGQQHQIAQKTESKSRNSTSGSAQYRKACAVESGEKCEELGENASVSIGQFLVAGYLLSVENVTAVSVEWPVSTAIRYVTPVKSLWKAKHVGKTSDITHYLFGTR